MNVTIAMRGMVYVFVAKMVLLALVTVFFVLICPSGELSELPKKIPWFTQVPNMLVQPSNNKLDI